MDNNEVINLEMYDFGMTTQGKVSAAIMSGLLGAAVACFSYVIVTKTTEQTVDSVKVLMDDAFEIRQKVGEDG
jgi:hypothetical protein